MIIAISVRTGKTKYIGKISLGNPKRLLRKLQKNLWGYFFATPCINPEHRVEHLFYLSDFIFSASHQLTL